MNNRYKFVVFDFDGVVCDSTNECMVTAWNAWERWNDRAGFRQDLLEFSQTEKDIFHPLRPYVRGAGEYYTLMRVINSPTNSFKNQEEFDQLCKRWKNNVESFKKIFFKERKRLKNENISAWINLHEVFNDVIIVLQRLNDQKRLLIATLKDYDSVKLILDNNYINIDSENILDQSKISSKLEALDYFIQQKKILKKDICFIDDNITHLIDPLKESYNVFWAAWCNSLKEFKEMAEKKIF